MSVILWMLVAATQQGAPAIGQAVPGAILLDRTRADRAPPVAQPPAAPSVAAPVSIAASTATGAPIRGIRFAGARAPAPVARAAERFVGRLATRETLAKLAQALSAAYAHSGVALYTVSIPRQGLAGGVVTVLLTEGRIAHVAVKATDGRRHPLLAKRLDRLTEETPLSRATFERQLTLARAIPGLAVDPQLTDPAHTGALDLTTTAKQRPVKVTAGFTNRGIDLLGPGEFDLRGEVDGLASDGDQFVLAGSSSIDFTAYRAASASYLVPIGASGLIGGATVAYLETRPHGYPVDGTAAQAGLSLAYPMIRAFTRSADLSLSLDGLDSDAAAFGNLLSREHSRALRLAASYAVAKPRRSFSLSGSVSHGLSIAGARANPLYADLRFTKVSATVTAAQAIGRKVVMRITGSGQFSDDLVPVAERFAIGGDAIGRAFDTAVLSGDRGAGGSGELAWRPMHRAAFSASEVYAFIDGGGVFVLPRGDTPAQSYRLASTGLGVRARYKTKAELGLEGAHALVRPGPGVGDDWRVLVSWRLSVGAD